MIHQYSCNEQMLFSQSILWCTRLNTTQIFLSLSLFLHFSIVHWLFAYFFTLIASGFSNPRITNSNGMKLKRIPESKNRIPSNWILANIKIYKRNGTRVSRNGKPEMIIHVIELLVHGIRSPYVLCIVHVFIE